MKIKDKFLLILCSLDSLFFEFVRHQYLKYFQE